MPVSRNLRSAIALGALVVAIPMTAAGTAAATGGDRCGQNGIEYSVDGGQSWTTNGRMDDALHTKLTVRLTGDVKSGCDYKVSLASYSAEGPTWKTSGTQKFLGWATTTLGKGSKQATLDVSAYKPTCFGQVDLYGNGKKFDGTNGNKLPHFDDSPFPTDLITAWNGGTKCAPGSPSPSASPSTSLPPLPSTSPSTSPSASPSTSTSTSPSPSASPSGSTSASPSPSGSTSASPSTSASTPATTPSTPGTPPVGTPVVPPVTTQVSPALAETGGNSSQTMAITSAAAAFLLLGGGGVFLARRLKRTSGN